MVYLKQITSFLDNWLNISEIEDRSLNGLQVGGKSEVYKIGVAVDASMETFQKALQQKCDMIIVHHGLLWKDVTSVSGTLYNRIKYLMQTGMSFYAAHLPLDKHNEVGNNIQICKLLDLKNLKEFGLHNGVKLGFSGELESEISFEVFVELINKRLDTQSKFLNFGPKTIKKVGVVSGGGSRDYDEARNEKIDCYITGEMSNSTYHFAKENNINVIAAGHYKTEVFGVKALASLIEERFGVETVFIDVPTGI